ncbi:hypothetical protein HELRODRAFT_166584 [Helobdella robusta]|uniref:Uncharacterized protein n=1 Tax=Helobdella robusta TaxID=6412 RepID=T1EY99_HELRO|nr:hypothetical protein HELRODRAFT_166584 [Helobdella robusta]ESO11576.1 hypothetical protein HELRODRAFT_166584 [Helobdella robusta]
MWLVAKNSSLLSPDLRLIILHIALRNLKVLGSIGPRTSIHIGKNSIEERAFPYFFIFSSAALAAAKPHSLLVRFTYRSARVPGTVTSHAKHLPAFQGISVHPSGAYHHAQKCRMGGAQGSVKFAQFRRVNVFRCTQEVHQFGQTEGIADNSQGIMGRKTGNTTQGKFKLRELLTESGQAPDRIKLMNWVKEFNVSSIGKGPEKTFLRCWDRRPSRPPEEPFLNDLTALSTSAGETQPAVGVNAGKTRLSTGIFGWIEHNLSKVAGELSARPSGEQTSLTAEDRFHCSIQDDTAFIHRSGLCFCDLALLNPSKHSTRVSRPIIEYSLRRLLTRLPWLTR